MCGKNGLDRLCYLAGKSKDHSIYVKTVDNRPCWHPCPQIFVTYYFGFRCWVFLHSWWGKNMWQIIFVKGMAFCYQNCSDQLWEKSFWDHWNNLFKQWKVRTIFGKRMHAFLTCSWRLLISNRLEFKLEKKYWDLETCRKI